MVLNRIQEIRKDYHLSIVKLSELLGVSRIALHDFEINRYQPRLIVIYRLLVLFPDLDFFDIFYEV